MKVKRVQKYVETLDMLKMKNSTPTSSSGNVASSVRSHKPRQASRFAQEQVSSGGGGGGGERNSVGQAAAADQQHSAQSSRHSSSSGSVVITTQWETFDSAVPVPVPPSASSSSTASAQPRFNWDLL